MINRVNAFFKSLAGKEKKASLLNSVDTDSLLPSKSLMRLGTLYGGWFIPIDSGLSDNSICYTAGAGEDISFDCELVKRFNCNVRILDPTPRAVEHFEKLKKSVEDGILFPINNSQSEFYDIAFSDFEKLRFIPAGISDQDNVLKFFFPKNPLHVSCSIKNLQKTDDFFLANCYRLSTLMNDLGDHSLDLLKIDIEGAEYGVIQDIIQSHMILPKLFLVEFDEIHSPLDSSAMIRIKDHIDMILNAGMRCIAIEGSNVTFSRI